MHNEDMRIEIDNFYQNIKEANEAIKILQSHCSHSESIQKKTKKGIIKICIHCDKEIKTKKKGYNYA